jgi:hypothetical protein
VIESPASLARASSGPAPHVRYHSPRRDGDAGTRGERCDATGDGTGTHDGRLGGVDAGARRPPGPGDTL